MNPVLTQTTPGLVQLVPEKGCMHQLPCHSCQRSPGPPQGCLASFRFWAVAAGEKRGRMESSRRGHRNCSQQMFALVSWQRKINSEWILMVLIVPCSWRGLWETWDELKNIGVFEFGDDQWSNEIYLGRAWGNKHCQGSLCDLTDFTLSLAWICYTVTTCVFPHLSVCGHREITVGGSLLS